VRSCCGGTSAPTFFEIEVDQLLFDINTRAAAPAGVSRADGGSSWAIPATSSQRRSRPAALHQVDASSPNLTGRAIASPVGKASWPNIRSRKRSPVIRASASEAELRAMCHARGKGRGTKPHKGLIGMISRTLPARPTARFAL